MREVLIRYLLGELDEIEQRALQQRLAASPELRRELAHLRTCFAASCHGEELSAAPPRGLAERTSERVAGVHSDHDEAMSLATGQPISAPTDPPAGALGWSLADLTVAGGVMLAVSMLLFPALRDSRDKTRRHVCQDNQRQLWVLAADYAQGHPRRFVPQVMPNENAGIFTVRLVEKGYITADELALLLFCPGAPLADEVRSGHFAIQVPTAAQLAAMSDGELAQARAKMSPFIAYRFPYRVGPNYYYIRDDRQPFSPLFSDTSGAEQDGMMSPNHGGSIVQVTYQDGSLRSLRSCTLPGLNDDLFRNSLGLVAAGLGRQDSVLGRSEATPEAVAASAGRYASGSAPFWPAGFTYGKTLGHR
jgi:hypothetical protein